MISNCQPSTRSGTRESFGISRSLATSATVVVTLMTLAAMVGCGGDNLDRQILYGRVTYNGQSVTGGDILFVPVGDTVGPTTGAKIVDGQYRADHAGGVPIGRHQIRVRGFLNEIPPTPQGGPDNIIYPTVPNEFYTASTIEINVEPSGAESERHFDLLTGMKLNQPQSP